MSYVQMDANGSRCEGSNEHGGFGKVVSNSHMIYVNGLEDMGGINFKMLTEDETKNFEFPNLEVAFTFYNWYARLHGFSARKSKVRRNKFKEVVQQNFVCYREGFREDRFKNNKLRMREARADTRCGCEANCVAHINKHNQRWYIRYINNEHNHNFVEQEFISFLSGHRGMDDDDILQMNSFRKSGIRTSQIFGSFASQSGGFQHVTFSVQDMYNEVDKERRSKGTDSRAALSYLRSLKNADPTLFWKHTVDKEGRLEHLFWSKSSQPNYSISTAIVANEIEETYVWLLETFLEAMQGKMPVSVITDGYLAMRNAIKRVFPTSHHRLCAWHLIRNATSNVKSTRFTMLFKKLMLVDYEIVDFERKWNEMLVECGVQDNVWVLDLYEKKDMWATAHIRGKFFGGFRTTSRCEGLHAKIGTFVNYRNNLAEFLEHFNQCTKYLRFKELEADFSSMHGDRVLQTEFRELEKSASKVYTKNIFFLFRSILQRSSAVKVIGCKQTATCFIYIVTKYRRYGTEWHVSYWPSTMDIKCSCLRMESIGIPCDHIVGVMVYLNMVELPSCLILERWTQNVKDSVNYSSQGQSSGWDSMTVCRYKSLNQRCRDVNSFVCKFPDAYAETLELLNDHYEHVKRKYGLEAAECVIPEERHDRFLQNSVNANTKGRGGRGTSKNQNKHKRRKVHCGLCGLVGHNRQTCPGLTNPGRYADEEYCEDDESTDGEDGDEDYGEDDK